MTLATLHASPSVRLDQASEIFRLILSASRFTATQTSSRRSPRERPGTRGSRPPGGRPAGPRGPGLGGALRTPPSRLRPGAGSLGALLRDPRDPSPAARRRAVLEYNRQHRKTFSQLMRKARRPRSALCRRRPSPSPGQPRPVSRTRLRPPSVEIPTLGRDAPTPRSRPRNLGGKDLYRQARAIWEGRAPGDPRARSSLAQLDAGTKPIHAAYKDLRRRDRFSAGFRPTPYDVWSFKHDRASASPTRARSPPRSSPTLHYFSAPKRARRRPDGGGTTLDVCVSMGRRCLAYDLHPVRPDIRKHDVRCGLPPETHGCDLVFCDPPYHTMLARVPRPRCREPLAGWFGRFSEHTLGRRVYRFRPGGYIALLLANQTEKDLPAGSRLHRPRPTRL